jgi:hypothetical protein
MSLKSKIERFYYGEDRWGHQQVKIILILVLRYLQLTGSKPNIYGCVLDSPYSNLVKLAK